MGSEARGWGVCKSFCVWSFQPSAEAPVWMSLSASEAFGLLPAELVGVEGPWMMAVGMAPACQASEVAGFLCVPGSRERCHRLCGKEGCPGVENGTALGLAWEGPRRKAEVGVLGE